MSRKPTAEEIEEIKFIFLELPDIIAHIEQTINNMTDSEFEKKIKEYPTFYFAYPNGQINQSYQDYKKFRMGIIGNE